VSLDSYRTVDVPTEGGTLRTGLWGDGPRLVVAAHGVTGNHTCWWPLARALGPDVTLAGPDLRGRGGSAALPGPSSIATHAADVCALVEHLGAERVVLVGHSMGAFVACAAALRRPDVVHSLILVDGGAPLPIPASVSVDEAVTAALGMARRRLDMTFATREAYLDFWRPHPALSGPGEWTDDVERYLMYDLVGTEPELRSGVSLDAVLNDSRDVLTAAEASGAMERLHPAVFVRAVRGIMNEEPPLYPEERVAGLRERWPAVTDVVTVPDTNHYTIVLGDRGSAVIARLVAETL